MDGKQIKPGHFVKIRLEAGDDGGERFWVLVERVEGQMIYGKVDNHLVYTDIHGYKAHDPIEFHRDEVLDWMDGVPRH